MDKNAVSTAFGGYPAFLPEEIDYWLEQALLTVMSQKFTGNNSLSTPFEKSVKRIADLEKLIKTDKELTVVNGDANDVILPNVLNTTGNNKRMFFVEAFLHFGNQLAPITIISHDAADSFKSAYNNKPWLDNPVAVFEDNSMIIYYDEESMVGEKTVDLTYVKVPTKVKDMTSESYEIPEHVWVEVINKAVLLALNNIESQRTQSKTTLNTLNE